jgi:hypothetical protein
VGAFTPAIGLAQRLSDLADENAILLDVAPNQLSFNAGTYAAFVLKVEHLNVSRPNISKRSYACCSWRSLLRLATLRDSKPTWRKLGENSSA